MSSAITSCGIGRGVEVPRRLVKSRSASGGPLQIGSTRSPCFSLRMMILPNQASYSGSSTETRTRTFVHLRERDDRHHHNAVTAAAILAATALPVEKHGVSGRIAARSAKVAPASAASRAPSSGINNVFATDP